MEWTFSYVLVVKPKITETSKDFVTKLSSAEPQINICTSLLPGRMPARFVSDTIQTRWKNHLSR